MDQLNYTISEASERLDNISHRTLHYYEKKIGLIINRDGAGNRIYSEDDIELFERILELKKRGMTLDGIRTFFEEKGIVKPENDNSVVVIDERNIELKNLLLSEIKSAVAEQIKDELKTTNSKIESLITENTELKEAIKKLQRDNIEHYNKIDEKLSSWRNSSDRPWYKKIFKK